MPGYPSSLSILTAVLIVAVWLLLQFVLIRHSSLWNRINAMAVVGLALAVFALVNGSYLIMVAGLAMAFLGLFRRRRPSPPPPSAQ